eukprot:6176126-Pleurochrysis_carterae.AAC.2
MHAFTWHDLPRETVRKLGGELIIGYNTYSQRSVGNERGRRGWARLRGSCGSGALRQSLPWALRVLQNSESGARALCKYACNATAIWKTMHVGFKL